MTAELHSRKTSTRLLGKATSAKGGFKKPRHEMGDHLSTSFHNSYHCSIRKALNSVKATGAARQSTRNSILPEWRIC